MATLVLENVPDELMQRIERLAAADRLPVVDETVKLLRDAASHRHSVLSVQEAARAGRTVEQVLADIDRNRLPYVPGEPTVVEMIREDRDR